MLHSKKVKKGKIVADTNGYEYVNHSVPGHTTTNLIARLSQPEVTEALEKADINIPSFFTASLDIMGFIFNLMGSVYDFIYNLFSFIPVPYSMNN